jgi:outer membrane protein assembly factor BamB
VIVGDTAVIAFGRNDRGKPRLHGVRLVGTGDVTASGHAWLRDDVGTFVPSPVAHGGKIYIVRDGGEVECLDPATGRSFWQNSFPKHRTNYYASPVIAAGKIYAPREDGVVFVASLSDNGMKVLSENNMQEPIIGSPVPVNGRLLLRGEKHLFCLSSDKR